MSSRAHRTLIVGLLAISVPLAGCGNDEQATDEDALSASAVAERYGYDPQTGELSPVYALVPELNDPRDIYARNLLLKDCLKGVAEFTVYPPAADPATEGTHPRTAQRNFNEAIAQQWGYQLPAPANLGTTGFPPGFEITPAIDEKILACGDKTASRLGRPPSQALAAIESAGWDALDANPPTVDSAAEAWVECMAPAGVVDLPDDPDKMPSPSVGAASSGQGMSAPGAVAPTAREREVAVLDAQCRETAGFDSAQLRVRAEAELAAIGRDVQGFESARQAYKDYDQKIDEVIRQLGG